MHREGGHYFCDFKLLAQQKINGIFPFLLVLCFVFWLLLELNRIFLPFHFSTELFLTIRIMLRYMIKIMMIMHLSVANFSTEWSLFCFSIFSLRLSSVHTAHRFPRHNEFKKQKKRKKCDSIEQNRKWNRGTKQCNNKHSEDVEKSIW